MLEPNKELKFGGMSAKSSLKPPTNSGLKKLPKKVRNKMGFKKAGGMIDECQTGGCYNSQRAASTRRRQNQARRNPNMAKRREMGLGKSRGGNGLGSKILGLGALVGGAVAAKRFMSNS